MDPSRPRLKHDQDPAQTTIQTRHRSEPNLDSTQLRLNLDRAQTLSAARIQEHQGDPITDAINTALIMTVALCVKIDSNLGYGWSSFRSKKSFRRMNWELILPDILRPLGIGKWDLFQVELLRKQRFRERRGWTLLPNRASPLLLSIEVKPE